MKWVSKAPLPTVGEPGEVRLVPETAEDLWHTYNMLAIGDALSANTIRKVNHHLGWLLLLPHACMRRLSTLQTPSSITMALVRKKRPRESAALSVPN
jgi:hypothetical protein